FLISPRRPSKVRIVERFETRGGRAAVAGDRTRASDAASTVEDWPHRFSVLVPEDLTADEAAMVERLVRLEKPTQADFDVRHYWDGFRVDEARLGIDTVLGEPERWVRMVLGQNYLGQGYVEPSFPASVSERVVSDRDRIGRMPAL